MRRSLLCLTCGVTGFLAGALSSVAFNGDGGNVAAMGDSASLSCEPPEPGLKNIVAGLRDAVVEFQAHGAPRLQLDADSPQTSGSRCHWSGGEGDGTFTRRLVDVWCVAPCMSSRDTMAGD